MMDIDSLKLYYYDGSWNQVSSIDQFPSISKRVDSYSICTVVLSDFEGALYSTWYSRDNTQMKIEDDFGNVLFQGYLKDKKFTGDSLALTIWGFASRLDESPFNQDFVLTSGLVKSAPWDSGFDYYNLSLVDHYELCWDGTNYWIVDYNNSVAKKYTTAWAYVSSQDLSGDFDFYIAGLTFDGTYYYVSGRHGATYYLRKYNTSWVLQASQDTGTIQPGALCNDGTYIYLAEPSVARIYVYNLSLVYQEYNTIEDIPNGIEYCVHNKRFYISDATNDVVYIYDYDWALVDTIEITNRHGIAYRNKTLYMAISDGTGKIYLYDEDLNNIASDNYLEVKQDDQDGGYPDFAWTEDYWINDREVGLLIKDNTTGDVSENYTVSSFTATNDDNEVGQASDADTAYDGNVYYIDDTSGSANAYVEAAVDGDNIADTNTLRKININYRFANTLGPASITYYSEITVYLQIKKGSSWTTIAQVYNFNNGAFTWTTQWCEGTFEIEGTDAELQDYLDKTGSDYDSLKGIKLYMSGTRSYNHICRIEVDYLTADVYYHTDDISPIMTKIVDSGASWLVAIEDFSTNGVQANDNFYIGANTYDILNAIQAKSLTDIKINSTLSKYMARKFKGSNCMQALQDVCQLEGCHWAEDHANGFIVVSKEADFEDSGLDLITGMGDDDFAFEDHVNHYKGVHVHGNASLNIEGIAEDLDSTSFKWYQITDDTIMTNADAQDVADSELAELQDKRPSLIFSKMDIDGTYSATDAMKTMDVTVIRPSIAQTTYVIRRIDINRVGEYLKYTFYCGFGSTPEEEQEANFKRNLAYLLQKQNVFRLANTPLGAGASISPDDIAGLDSYILSLLSSNAAVSIEWDDDDGVANDIVLTDITADATWRELDLDSYGVGPKSKTVPTGTIGAFVKVVINSATATSYFFLRSTSQSNSVQISATTVQVSNVQVYDVLYVPIDADHKFDYFGHNTLSLLYMTVLAWVKVVQ